MNSAVRSAIQQGVVAFAIAATPALIGRIARRFSPSSAAKPTDRTWIAEERRRLTWPNTISALSYLAAAAVCTYVYYLVARDVAGRWFAPIPNASLLAPAGVIWVLPAMAAGMATGADLRMPWVRRLLGSTFDDLDRLEAATMGLTPSAHARLERRLIVGLYAFAAAFFLLTLDAYVVFDANGIEVHPFFSLATIRHVDGDVAAIRHVLTWHAPDGTAVAHRPYYEIEFRDGTLWTTRQGPWDPDEARDRPIIARVAERTGLAVENVERAGPPAASLPCPDRSRGT